jgi:hypothetical protein
MSLLDRFGLARSHREAQAEVSLAMSFESSRAVAIRTTAVLAAEEVVVVVVACAARPSHAVAAHTAMVYADRAAVDAAVASARHRKLAVDDGSRSGDGCVLVVVVVHEMKMKMTATPPQSTR